jgi:hypothetical protein
MIYINLSLINPWSDRFEPKWSWSKLISKYKAIEVEFYRSNTVAEFECRLRHREDHAGLALGLGLFSYTLRAQFYDTRHWNYADNCWEVYDDKENLL